VAELLRTDEVMGTTVAVDAFADLSIPSLAGSLSQLGFPPDKKTAPGGAA
jgi:hypothetical protein